MTNKPRIIKNFENLDQEIQEQIKLAYPAGFEDHLVSYRDKDNVEKKALPFETEEKYYLVRMTVKEAQQIIIDDDDYDDEGFLKEESKDTFDEKYTDEDMGVNKNNDDDF